MKKVVIGMSGGVDSSVCALLLKEQGYEVIALFMKNWEEHAEDGICRSAQDYDDVVKVCEQLGIAYYAVNFVQEYREQVFTHFLNELREGHTPNPDILCNREIKFKVFLEKALSLGADLLATGHYCQIGEENTLYKGADPNKDQSYFLYTLEIERGIGLAAVGFKARRQLRQRPTRLRFGGAGKLGERRRVASG